MLNGYGVSSKITCKHQQHISTFDKIIFPFKLFNVVYSVTIPNINDLLTNVPKFKLLMINLVLRLHLLILERSNKISLKRDQEFRLKQNIS